MSQELLKKPFTLRDLIIALVISIILICGILAVLWYATKERIAPTLKHSSTLTGSGGEIGEPYGIATIGNTVYISDGQNDKVWSFDGKKLTAFATGLDTPSSLAVDHDGNIIVADTGSHTIKSINSKGLIETIAGVSGKAGSADGDAATSSFNAPIGVVADPSGRIYVADTYNDRIRVIENGKVSTIAGSTKGYGEGSGENAKFDTPTGLAIWQDKLLVADTGNRRIRVVEPNGIVWTLAGNGEADIKNGLLGIASFYQPTAIVVAPSGILYITDGNAIRRIGGTALPVVMTISDIAKGFDDGNSHKAKFDRPSGLAITKNGELLVADSENRVIRKFSSQPGSNKNIGRPDDMSAAEFRDAAPARWPYDPPTAVRDVAGTLGEIRGEMTGAAENVWFHNGLDIAGALGETARFVRDEKVLRPIAAENFGSLRELIRMPNLGYIHIRLGRNSDGKPFDDERFQFTRGPAGRLIGIRVPRGSKFRAGEAIGTLNPMNHVHLIAGRSGREMNAIDALALPGIADARSPIIEKVEFYDQNWDSVETTSANERIKLSERTRIVVKAYDQMDGNAERRRLGVYKLGYQVLNTDKTPLTEVRWTITFDKMPSNEAVKFAYAIGSHSGATGETIFRYIVTNFVNGEEFREEFLENFVVAEGPHTIRVFAADYFGNTTSKDIEVIR